MAELNYYVTSVETPTISDGTYGNYGETITIAPSGSYGASDDEDFQLQTEYILWIHARAGYTVSAANFSYQGATPYAYGNPQAPDLFLYQEWSGDAPEDAVVPVFPEINGATAIKSVSFEDTPYFSFEQQMEWELAEQGITEDDAFFETYMESAVISDQFVFQNNPGIGNKIKVTVKLHEGWQMPAEDVVINVDIDGFAEVYVDESDIDLEIEIDNDPSDPIDPEWDWDDYDIDDSDDENDLNVDGDVTYADNEDEDTEEDGDTLNEDGDGDDLGDEPDDDIGDDIDLIQDETQEAVGGNAFETDDGQVTLVTPSVQGVFAKFSFSQTQVNQNSPGIKHKDIFDGIDREEGDIITVNYSIRLRNTPLFEGTWPYESIWITTKIAGESYINYIGQNNGYTINREVTATEDNYNDQIHIKFEDTQPLAAAQMVLWNISVLVKDQFNNTKKYYIADLTQLHDSNGQLVEELSAVNPLSSTGLPSPVSVSGPNGNNPNVDGWRAAGVNGNMIYQVHTGETVTENSWFMYPS